MSVKNTFLVITSIAGERHPILNKIAQDSLHNNLTFILIGDAKSPQKSNLRGCDYYSIDRQRNLDFTMEERLPYNYYSRKNLGYLAAMAKGAEIIIETDDDNWPMKEFWNNRELLVNAHHITENGWVNVYKYFTDAKIWPRGFPLENIKEDLPLLNNQKKITCPIQQGLADKNPDVDAIYRLVMPLPVDFDKSANIALGMNSLCPFNSQNTTWFEEAFMLLYLPSYCSFPMTDIWRSFVAQRIAWTCGWSILFHKSTVWQDRNDHRITKDFEDEISGYLNNSLICKELKNLDLSEGIENIPANMKLCYQKFVELDLINISELELLNRWITEVKQIM